MDEDPILTNVRTLEDMSIDELKARIETLKQEISSCESQIEKKEASRMAADAAFFKK